MKKGKNLRIFSSFCVTRVQFWLEKKSELPLAKSRILASDWSANRLRVGWRGQYPDQPFLHEINSTFIPRSNFEKKSEKRKIKKSTRKKCGNTSRDFTCQGHYPCDLPFYSNFPEKEKFDKKR